jgi:hypothetical protein
MHTLAAAVLPTLVVLPLSLPDLLPKIEIRSPSAHSNLTPAHPNPKPLILSQFPSAMQAPGYGQQHYVPQQQHYESQQQYYGTQQPSRQDNSNGSRPPCRREDASPNCN